MPAPHHSADLYAMKILLPLYLKNNAGFKPLNARVTKVDVQGYRQSLIGSLETELCRYMNMLKKGTS